MNHQAAAQFGLKPGCLGRHDLTAVGNVHNLLHGDGVESQCGTHLTAVHAAFQFAETTQSANEVDALGGTQVADVQNLIENQPAGNVHVEHADGVAVVVSTLLSLE